MVNAQPHVRLIRRALLAASRAFISSWPAAPVALLSGGAMMGAGYLVRTVGWGPASLATIPGGVLIFVAFRLARRRQPTTRDRTSESPAVSRVRTHLLKQPGLLEGLSLRSQFVILGLTMASGAVMVSAGFAWAAQSLISAAALAVVGGLFIAGAFHVAAAPRRRRNGHPNGVVM